MIKDLIVDMDNRFNEVFSSFDPLNKEFAPGSWIINIFSSCFLFYSFNKYSNKNFKTHSHQLNNISIISSLDPSYACVVTDTSIKNNIATFITHIHVHNKPVIKTIYYTVNVTSIEAGLFTIRCGINQATNISGISKIVIIMDLLHAAWRIFDSLLHSF